MYLVLKGLSISFKNFRDFHSSVVCWAGVWMIKTKPQSPGVSLKIIANFTPVVRYPEIQPHTNTTKNLKLDLQSMGTSFELHGQLNCFHVIQ